jgi:hypothetical protein
MAIGFVLDPTVDHAEAQRSTAGAVGHLTGKTVGVRIDTMWRSWDWVTDEWAPVLRDAGASLVTWRSGARNGPGGERMENELARFANEVDLAVVGLGN